MFREAGLCLYGSCGLEKQTPEFVRDAFGDESVAWLEELWMSVMQAAGGRVNFTCSPAPLSGQELLVFLRLNIHNRAGDATNTEL